MLWHQQPDQIGITRIAQAQIEIGHDRDRHEQVAGQHQRCVENHRPVGAAHHRDRRGFLVGQSHGNGDGERQQGAEFRHDRDEHAAHRGDQHISDIRNRPDPHEDQAGDQTVAEGKCVNRLQEIDLQDVQEFCRFARDRIDEDRSHGSRREKENAGIDARHPDSHGNHDERFERSLDPPIDEGDSERDQHYARERNERIGRHHGGDALKDVEKFDLRHGQAFLLRRRGRWHRRRCGLGFIAPLGAVALHPNDDEEVLDHPGHDERDHRRQRIDE